MEQSNEFVLKVLMNVDRIRYLRQFAHNERSDTAVSNQMTELVCKILDVPVAIVTLVTDEFQFFTSEVGVEEPWKSKHGTPLSHSFCQYAVATGQPFIVENANEHELVKTNPAVDELNVQSYLGIPLALHNGISLGSLGAVDHHPRRWSQVEIDIMQQLSETLRLEFETRARVYLWQATQDDLALLRHTILRLINQVNPQQPKEAILEQIKTLRNKLDLH